MQTHVEGGSPGPEKESSCCYNRMPNGRNLKGRIVYFSPCLFSEVPAHRGTRTAEQDRKMAARKKYEERAGV